MMSIVIDFQTFSPRNSATGGFQSRPHKPQSYVTTTPISRPFPQKASLLKYGLLIFRLQAVFPSLMPRRLSVILPDGRRFSSPSNPSTTAADLKRKAAELLSIPPEDEKLFGITEEDESGQIHWLRDENVVQEQQAVLHFRVRFFVDSVTSLHSPAAIECYFLSTLDTFMKDQLVLSPTSWSQMMAHLVAIFGGDLDREEAEKFLRQSIPEPLRLSDPATINEILEMYGETKGVSRGLAIIRFLQLAERSPHYGCCYYDVSRLDGSKCLLGVCSRGIVVSQLSKEYKIFYWKQLDNLYYKNNQFTLEVHGNRTPVKEGLAEVGDAELTKAVSDPTTQVSSVQRRQIRLHSFRCNSASIWQAAIMQHQFYLDQKHRKPRNTAGRTEEISRLISNSSLCSSLPSLSSLHAASSTSSMPAAKVVDGSSSTTSLPSLKGRTEEEKTQARERYALLKNRHFKLENDLREKMKELLAVCLKEGEVTGVVPKEIKKALYPGEEVPKVKKRIGTSFSIPEELIRGDRANRLVQLETDVELHRKIVAAAEKLAKDKSMNKSVRKKRQKDLQAATMKLKGLEVGLSQLRLSASKPDVSSLGSNGSAASWSGLAESRMVAKSCPTTPHGSVPDLHQNGVGEVDSLVYRRPPSEISRQSLAQRFSSSSSSSLGLPPSGQRSSFTQRSVTSDELDNPLTSPIYENVGYRSTCYRSSYRQAHYPTIQDEQRRRSASAHSVAREAVAPVAVVAPTPVARRMPTSVSCSFASLDRRETRTQQPAKVLNHSGSSPSTNRVTTFPVAQANLSYDNCLPRFQRPSLAHFPNRGALPPYSLGQSVSSGRLQTNTDPHMEALLHYYKTEARKTSQKTATIV